MNVRCFVKSFLALQFFLWVLVASSAAQIPPPPPPPVARSTPPPKSELTDAELEAKIAKTLSKPQAWKSYEFPGFAIKVDLPREPVRQTESFYDEALGNAKTEVHVAVGDDATYLVGYIQLPYALTEEKLLREAYQEAIKQFAADPEMKFESPRDIYFNGRLGVEAISVVPNERYLPAKLRMFILGRAIYLLMATPPPTDEAGPPSKEARNKLSAEFDAFFASAKAVTPVPQASTTEEATLRGTFSNRVYRSEYFDFSFTVPESWLRVAQEDVEGLRKWGHDYLSQNIGRPLPTSKSRRNLATFISKPLGNERVAMIAINLGIPADKPDSAMQMAKLTESVLGKVQTYTLLKSASRTKLGNAPAVSIEGTIKVADDVQNQVVYFLEHKGFVLGFTVNYYDAADRQKADAALQTLKIGTP